MQWLLACSPFCFFGCLVFFLLVFLSKVYIVLWRFVCVFPTYLPAYTGTLRVCSISHISLNFHDNKSLNLIIAYMG